MFAAFVWPFAYPNMLLAIDPGANTGWATFDSCRRLTACGLVSGPASPLPPMAVARVVIECAELRGRGEKNPNSILLMARVAGEWWGRYHSHCPEYILPADWKGTTPKDIDHRRTFARLAPFEELAALVRGCAGVSPKSAPIDAAIHEGLTKSDKRANILDAIGIGLWAVGRGVRT